MKLLILESKDPYYNLAVEEYLFRHGTGDIFMLWQNEPTVVIGCNQNAYAEVDFDVLREKGIHLARRITGGGAVYHDLGNVNYTLISDRAENGIDFSAFTAPVLSALATLGIKAELSGRNDLLVDGKKFSGNAQYSNGGRTLHHGTLLFDSDLEMLSHVLRPDEEKIKSKAVKSVRSRVTNLSSLLQKNCDTGTFIALLADFVREKYAPEEIAVPVCEEIDRLCARNASSEWLYPARGIASAYSITRKKRYPFGTVCVSLHLGNDFLKSLTVTGDFFGTEPITALEALLENTPMRALEARLAGVDLSRYIHGMSTAEFLALLKNE